MTIDVVTHYLRHGSSFAVTWMLCWLLLYVLVWAVYPGLRTFMRKLHPATASNLLLALLALPFLTSLLATALVFSPLLEQNIITAHYHSPDCERKFPILKSGVTVGGVLSVVALVLLGMMARFLSHLMSSLRLESRLQKLGEQQGQERWMLLPHKENLAFTMGWLKNTVFVTEGLLNQCSKQELDIILAHERAHAGRLDNLRLLAARLLLWLMPVALARKFIDDLHLYNEAACDFHTAEQHGRIDVAETLLRIHRLSCNGMRSANKMPLASAFNGPEVQDRVMLLLDSGATGKRRKFWPLLYLLVLLALGVLMVDPLHHGAEWLLEKIG